MLLTKVILKNYGVYRDENIFDFSCTQEKPIILIGGTNGAGKTTLFEAIMVGLYGLSHFDKRTSKKTYEKFLAHKIHRYLGTPVSADHASIIVDFKFYHGGKVEDYSVDRTWRNEDGRVIEELTITKDGRKLDSVEESQWQSFIEELIPKGIAKLFFFDGEKIVKIAEEGNEDLEIKSSFDSLLGLDLVEQLHSDLRIHIMRNMKGDEKSIQEQHDNLLNEKNEIMNDIAALKEKLVKKEGEIHNIAKMIDELETKISRLGGGYASKREELKGRKSFLEMKNSTIEDNIRAILEGLAPLCLIPEHLDDVKEQIRTDEESLKKQFEKKIVDERFAEIKSNLESEFKKTGVDPAIISEITSMIDRVFTGSSDGHTLKSLFNFSTIAYSNILNMIEMANNQILPELERETKSYNEINEELRKIETALINAPKDDEIGPLISRLNSLYSDAGMLKSEVSHIEQQIASKNAYVKMLNSKLRSIVAEKYTSENSTKQAELAKKVQNVLDEYVEKLKVKKLKLLEEYMLDAIRSLMHKENFIEKVSIDKDTFEITLYRQNGDPLPKDLLSKGEQQMFATATLLALAKTSGKPLPFMIDTPLARLDVEHRDNLVEKFFPFASHQVVIFSTDSEIDAEYYLKLLPHVSKSYAMEYLSDKGKTKLHEGYFWDKTGRKVVAV